MSQMHPTTKPESMKTDAFAVYADTLPNMELISTVEVPLYSQPNADGVRLSRDKRLALAVARAVESEDTMIPSGVKHDHRAEEGTTFYVSTEHGKMVSAEYEQNPSFDAVWRPDDD